VSEEPHRKLTRLIRQDDLSAFERWEMPYVDGRPAPRPTEPEPEPEPERLPQLTAEEIEAIQEEAYREGFEQGERDGLAAGQQVIDGEVAQLLAQRELLQQEQQALEQQAANLQQMMDQFAEPIAAVGERLQRELVTLALSVARQVVRQELQRDPALLLPLVREALAALPLAAQSIRLHLHPDDATLVRQQLTPSDDEPQRWRVVEDRAITAGGFRIESDRSRIDATLEKRLDEVVSRLLAGEALHDAQPASEPTAAADESAAPDEAVHGDRA